MALLDHFLAFWVEPGASSEDSLHQTHLAGCSTLILLVRV
jgi:hypothetical protein